MDISNGRLGFTQDLDNQKFLNALRQSNRGVTDFNAHLQQNFNQSLISVNDLAKGVTAFLTIDMARDFVNQMVKIRGEFEQTEIAFNTMLQSREKGNALMKEMVELAKNTPMQFSEVSKGAKQLLAYQVEAEKLTGTLSMLGDISSGLGVPISRLILVYGQVRAKGRLMGDDLRQFTEAGVPMIAMIAKNMGIAESAVADMVSEGKVGFKDVEKVLQDLTNQGGLFYNMMEEQSKTIPGQIAKLQDEIEQMFNSIGKDSQGFVSDVIGGVSTIVENYDSIGKTLGVLIGTYGAYKAALITVSAIETARAKTVATEISNLSISEKMQLGRLAVTQRQAQATLASAEADLVNNQAVLTTMRAEVSSLAIKKQKAVALAIERTQLAQTAKVQLALGQAELRSIQATGTAREIKIAQRNVEKAQNAVIATQEAAEVSRKSSLAASQTFYNAQQNLGNQSQRTKIAQTAVSNAQDAVSVATKNLNTAATSRLTLAQHAQALSAKAAATWQAFLNATMLANPFVAVTAVVGGLIAAYFILRDTTTAAEKAQEAYNETQEEVKSKLDETKQKAEEYINILKDETATVYQQIEAYKALQLLKLKGFEKLSLEQIQAMDINEIKKLVNEANDIKGLDLQKQKLSDIESQIKSIKSQIDNVNKSNGQGGLALDSLYKKLDVLNGQYNIQLSKVNEIDREMKFANMTLEQKKVYWENIISTTEKQISTIQEVNIKQNDTNNLANQVSNAFRSWDVSRLNFQLNEAQNQLVAINNQMTTAAPLVKNQPYWDGELKKATEDFKNSLPGTKEWIEANKKIDEANQALKAWDTSVKKVKKPKAPKKSDDPFEKYKKQIQSVKEDYDRFVDYMNSDDLILKNSGKIQYETLSKSGATYEEFLRRLQKQLVGTSNKSALQIKQLQFINDELVKVIDYNAFDKFKEGIESSISESENLLEVLGKIQEEKLKLQGNTDQISVDKLKFLDEKEIENINNIDKASKDLVKSFGGGMSELQIKTNEYNNDIANLAESLKRAKTEAEKIQINDAIWKRGVKFAEDTKDLPTNDDNYNKLLLEYKTFAQKKEQIEADFNNKIAVAKLNSDQSLENELLKQKKSALSKISLEYMQQSKSMMTLLGDLDKTTIKQLDKAINDIEKQLKDTDLALEMNPEDLKAVLDALKKAKEKIQKANPFKGIQDSWNAFWSASTDEDKLEALDQFLGSVNGALALTEDAIDAASSVVESFGGKLDSAAKQTIQSIQNIVNGIGNVIQGYFSGDIAQMVAGIVQIVVEVAKLIGGSKDKKRIKAINNHVNAVRELQRAYDDLKYSIDKALGNGSYNMNKDLIKNLEQQNKELEAAIKLEESRKKSKKDQNKINDWKDQITANIRSIQDILDEMANDILQTDAKDLASTLGDALVEAFGKGEDAAKSFEKVANDVLKNAILNQLKKKFLEEQLQGALDKLYEDMGGSKDGTFNWNGLSPEEQQAFRDKIKEISQNFSSMLGEYSDLFKDLTDPNESAMAGAIKGMSEETGNAFLGQFNAMRILQKELVTINVDSNKILLKSLDRLANIDYNTRSVLPLLEKLLYRIDNAGRAYGF